eukprot:TRINITY_DN3601_c0_g2_i1.p1 TRINITY_DN3601_c0_g2~~TRINITY_DN3601_c0_g2_i1.p1  ORF type:complete len:828 (-),score=150.70 TRINITY_DN3601_c0_g2_i1:216-2624(-)
MLIRREGSLTSTENVGVSRPGSGRRNSKQQDDSQHFSGVLGSSTAGVSPARRGSEAKDDRSSVKGNSSSLSGVPSPGRRQGSILKRTNSGALPSSGKGSSEILDESVKITEQALRDEAYGFLQTMRIELKSAVSEICEQSKSFTKKEKNPSWMKSFTNQMRTIVKEEMTKINNQRVRTGSVSAADVEPHEWTTRNVLVNKVERFREALHTKNEDLLSLDEEDGAENIRRRPIRRSTTQVAQDVADQAHQAHLRELAKASSSSQTLPRVGTCVKRQAVRLPAVHKDEDLPLLREESALESLLEADDTIQETMNPSYRPPRWLFLDGENDNEDENGVAYTRVAEKEEKLSSDCSSDEQVGAQDLDHQSSDCGDRRSSLALTISTCLRTNCSEGLICFVLVANASLIGLETDTRSRNIGSNAEEKEPFIFFVFECMFCAFFMFELAARIYSRVTFFTGPGNMWNIFDALVAMTSLFDIASRICFPDLSSKNMSFLRILRLTRIVRITRLIRVLRIVEELRTIVSSIMGSMKSLGWTLVLLFMMIYTVAICVTQLVIDHQISMITSGEVVSPEISHWYGSLFRTILTLYECIASGLSWDEAIVPLIRDISPWVGVVFCFYIAFSIFAMMNVVTGVFVEKAMQHAEEDKEEYLATHISEAFKRADADDSGEVTWEEFESRLEAEEMQEYFKAIDVDISEAKGLFKLIDADGSGSIDAVEFISGCMRLRGPAKALEMTLLLHEMNRMHEWLADKLVRIEMQVNNSNSMLNSIDNKSNPQEQPKPMGGRRARVSMMANFVRHAEAEDIS